MIGRDSTFQFILGEDEIEYIDGISIDQFNELLKPVIYTNDEYILSTSFTNHNKVYKLIRTYKDNLEQTVVYTVADRKAMKATNYYYLSIINLYNNTVKEEYNIILNGIWTGDITHLGETTDLIQLIMWYNNIMSRELNVHAFKRDSSIMLFNFENELIEHINFDGKLLKKVKINSSLNLRKFDIIYDEIIDKYYCYNKTNPIVNLYEIDFETGELNSVLVVKEVTFPEKVKVFNGWLYFIKINDAMFNKLYKIKI